VDYDDSTLQFIQDFGEINGVYDRAMMLTGVETSLGDGGVTGGAVLSGPGEWVFDTADSRLVAMADALEKPLTPKNCQEKYAEIWEASNEPDDDASGAISMACGAALSMMLLPLWSFFF
jgi:hypothetical protein